ncbi:DUF4190 domain-containing protein [Nonomuraea spiralis]|uniref:DUF4190 domain-containing protein n=1 Tax=Nonomuraea spiralis TaxID=46182 RepID=A0ABV5IXT9_9ACTN|nr:DUF4190 domain-containing protein [Nonomuraea spiralis]GGT35877.1 hypothetical protein GCM10010176_095200 [Nonomuraea spiralis]
MSYPNYGPSYYGPPPQTHPNGTTILVLGILSLVVCGILGPFAWSMGNKALKEIDGSGYPYDNRSAVQAGRICGMIATILLIIGAGFMVLGLGAGILSAIFSSN